MSASEWQMACQGQHQAFTICILVLCLFDAGMAATKAVGMSIRALRKFVRLSLCLQQLPGTTGTAVDASMPSSPLCRSWPERLSPGSCQLTAAAAAGGAAAGACQSRRKAAGVVLRQQHHAST